MAADNRHLTDRELLQAIDDELPARQRIHVEGHLAECSDCRTRHQRIRLTLQDATMAFRNGPALTVAMDSARMQLNAALDGKPTVRRTDAAQQRTRAVGWIALAAAAMCGFVLLNVPSAPWTSPRMERSGDAGARPIAVLTPGATWELTLSELCDHRVHEQRDVPLAVRQQVVRNYQMNGISPDEYELDYLITPELGGAPDPRNLWPQSYTSGTWTARVKDQLEALLPRMVCDREVALDTAQRDIAQDWIAAYKKYFKTDTPIRLQASVEDDRENIRYPVWRSGNSAVPRVVAFSPGH